MRVLGSSLVAICLVGCGSEPTEDPGKKVYEGYCALCHGVQGEGYLADRANALSNPEFLAAASDAFIRDGIALGRPGTKMSAWGAAVGGPLSEAQVADLVAYIRLWQKGSAAQLGGPATGDPERARSIYADRCASCHGAKGQGASAMSLNHAEFLKAASDGFLRYAIERGRSATPMGAYAGQLTPQQIDDLVLLIRTFK